MPSVDEYHRISISAVPISLKEWWTRDPDLLKELKQWNHEIKSIASILMTSFVDVVLLDNKECRKTRKEIAIYSADLLTAELIFKVLNASELSLTPLVLPHACKRDHFILAFEQGNTVASRKQVLPALETGFDSIVKNPTALSAISTLSH